MGKTKYRTVDECLILEDLDISITNEHGSFDLWKKGSNSGSDDYSFVCSSRTIQGCFKKLLEYVNTYGIE